MRVVGQGPHPDLHYALWSNLDDSSWVARDLAQTVTAMGKTGILHQIGQMGISITIVVLGLFLVFLTSMYEERQ